MISAKFESWKFQFPQTLSSSNLLLKGYLDIYVKGTWVVYIIYKSVAFALSHQCYIWYLIQNPSSWKISKRSFYLLQWRGITLGSPRYLPKLIWLIFLTKFLSQVTKGLLDFTLLLLLHLIYVKNAFTVCLSTDVVYCFSSSDKEDFGVHQRYPYI